MPSNILNLPAYTVTALQESDHDYHYHVDTVTTGNLLSCPHCDSADLVGFGRREQMVKDLPMHGKRVGLYVDTKRFKCRACTKTFYEKLPAVDEKRLMTRRLVEWVGKQAIKRTFASIAEEVGVTEGTVRSVFSDYVNVLERTVRFETPKYMGIDEIHMIKPRGVISNIENNTIIELLPNRNKETVIRYLSRLEGRDRIHYVAMDMWLPYKDAVELVLPQAMIVIDKFHVVKMANEAMERIRKSFRETLSPRQRRGLMHDRFVLLKRESELSDSEVLKLTGWLNNYPELGAAYKLKEDFFKIYDADSRHEALAGYDRWEKSIPEEIRSAFSDLIRAWRNWQPYILNYFDHPVTNAYAESLNNLIRVMNRLGRGYSFEALRAKILFAEGAFKKQIIKPKFERSRQEDSPFVSFAMMTSFQPEPKETVINYGVDISTLIEMIESGHI